MIPQHHQILGHRRQVFVAEQLLIDLTESSRAPFGIIQRCDGSIDLLLE